MGVGPADRQPAGRSGAGVTGTGGIVGERGGNIPFVEEDELAQGTSPDGAVVAHGSADGDGGGHEDIVGNAEQRPQLGLDEQVPARHDAAVAQGSGGEQKVLTGRIDRGTLHRVGRTVADEAAQDEHRCIVQMVDVVLHRASHGRLG